MGNSRSKEGSKTESLLPKSNKDHRRDKTFRIGLSFGKGDLSAEGHFQMGYVSKTKKVYTRFLNEEEVVGKHLRSVSEPIPIPKRKVTFQEEPEVRIIEEELETDENS